MKLVVLSSGFPYPIDAGRKVVLAGFLQFATSSLGAENVVLACISSDADEQRRSELCPCPTVFLSTAGGPQRAAGVLVEALLLRRRAIQEMLVYSAPAKDRIAALIDEFAPDVVLVDTIRLAQYVETGGRQRPQMVLYLDDLYSLRYRRTLQAMAQFPDAAIDAVGTFDRFLPKAARGIARMTHLQKAMLKLESDVLGKRERQMPALFDRVLLINSSEADLLATETGASNIAVVRPLLQQSRPRRPRNFDGGANYVFLGNLRYAANAYSLAVFLRRVMPKLVSSISGCRLLVVGGGASSDLRELGSSFGSSVQFLDYVPDLDDLMARSAAMIVPLIFGTGLKIKVLEAFFAGMPIVSTPCGVEGVSVSSGVECFVSKEIEGFVEPMKRLLDPNVNREMSSNSSRFYDAHFAPSVVEQQYRDLLFGASRGT